VKGAEKGPTQRPRSLGKQVHTQCRQSRAGEALQGLTGLWAPYMKEKISYLLRL
jgi:hypothetical protein